MEIKSEYKQTDVGLIPCEWDIDLLGNNVVKVGSGITPRGGEKVYKQEGRPFIRSQNVGWGKLILDDLAYIDEETHSSFKSTEIERQDVFLNITGASIGRSAVANNRVVSGNVNQHVCIIRTDKDKLDPYFLSYFLLTKNGQRQIESFQAGGNRQGLNYGQIRTFKIPKPPILEQTPIAEAISDADTLIASLEKLLAKKKDIKQGVMQLLLTGKRRLPGFSEEWKVKKIRELLNYEQPWKYAVKNTEYLGSGTPVLTANKSFILGYTDETDGICENIPVIIFDDFTTDSKYVDFPFKVKSSAIKLLRTKKEIADLKFMYGKIKLIKFHLGDHKRYYISEYQNLDVLVPEIEEQIAIAQVLSDMDTEIDELERKLAKYKLIKQGMMQELLTGKKRLT